MTWNSFWICVSVTARRTYRPAGLCELLLRVRPAGCLQHLDVAQDDPRDGEGLIVRLDRDHEVDVVALVQCAGEQLMLVACELERAHRALELGADPAFRRGREAARRDLLAGIDRLRRDEVEDLVGIRDGAWHHAAPNEFRLDEEALTRHVRAGGTRRNVPLRDEDRHVRLVLADVALVVRHVEARQERRNKSQRDCDRDVPDAVRHERLPSSPSWCAIRQVGSNGRRNRRHRRLVLRSPSQMTRVNDPSSQDSLLPWTW